MVNKKISVKRGDTWLQIFKWRSGTKVIDLIGCSAKLQLRNSSDGLVLSVSSSTGELEIDGAAGNISLRVEADVMGAIAPGNYSADLEVTFSDSTVMSTPTFTVEIIKDVTRV